MRLLSSRISAAGIALALASSAAEAAGARPGLSVNAQGVLVKDGRPFRGIGVNYFDAFSRHLLDPSDTSYEAGFAALARARVPFVRLMGCGFWPVEQKLYQVHREEFLRRFDDVVRAAERHHIGLIPSLFWNVATVPDLVGEPVSAWGDPRSKTQAYMRAYVKDLVTRCRRNRPPSGAGSSGTSSTWAPTCPTPRNTGRPSFPVWALRPAAVRKTSGATRRSAPPSAFAGTVRRYHPARVISTGDGFRGLRPRTTGRRRAGQRTLPRSSRRTLTGDNPDPVTVLGSARLRRLHPPNPRGGGRCGASAQAALRRENSARRARPRRARRSSGRCWRPSRQRRCRWPRCGSTTSGARTGRGTSPPTMTAPPNCRRSLRRTRASAPASRAGVGHLPRQPPPPSPGQDALGERAGTSAPAIAAAELLPGDVRVLPPENEPILGGAEAAPQDAVEGVEVVTPLGPRDQDLADDSVELRERRAVAAVDLVREERWKQRGKRGNEGGFPRFPGQFSRAFRARKFPPWCASRRPAFGTLPHSDI